jgi:hypothetical protein
MTDLTPLDHSPTSIFDVPADIARAYYERGYAPAQIEWHLAAKARRARMGIGIGGPRLSSPTSPNAAMFVAPTRHIEAETPIPAPDMPPIRSEDFIHAHWICDDLIRQANQGLPPKLELIKSVVAAEFDVSRHDLVSIRRTKRPTMARQVAMYLAKTTRPDSYPEIGLRFGGRDHTTALHAVSKISALVANSPEMAERIARLKARIEAAR